MLNVNKYNKVIERIKGKKKALFKAGATLALVATLALPSLGCSNVNAQGTSQDNSTTMEQTYDKSIQEQNGELTAQEYYNLCYKENCPSDEIYMEILNNQSMNEAFTFKYNEVEQEYSVKMLLDAFPIIASVDAGVEVDAEAYQMFEQVWGVDLSKKAGADKVCSMLVNTLSTYMREGIMVEANIPWEKLIPAECAEFRANYNKTNDNLNNLRKSAGFTIETKISSDGNTRVFSTTSNGKYNKEACINCIEDQIQLSGGVTPNGSLSNWMITKVGNSTTTWIIQASPELNSDTNYKTMYSNNAVNPDGPVEYNEGYSTQLSSNMYSVININGTEYTTEGPTTDCVDGNHGVLGNYFSPKKQQEMLLAAAQEAYGINTEASKTK